jgi:hypothetical protein
LTSAYLCILTSLLPISFYFLLPPLIFIYLFLPPSPFLPPSLFPLSLYSYRPLLIFLLYPLFFLCALSSLSLFFHSRPLHLFVFSIPLLIFEFSPPSPYLCILSSLPSFLYCQFLRYLCILTSLPISKYSSIPLLIFLFSIPLLFPFLPSSILLFLLFCLPLLIFIFPAPSLLLCSCYAFSSLQSIFILQSCNSFCVLLSFHLLIYLHSSLLSYRFLSLFLRSPYSQLPLLLLSPFFPQIPFICIKILRRLLSFSLRPFSPLFVHSCPNLLLHPLCISSALFMHDLDSPIIMTMH